MTTSIPDFECISNPKIKILIVDDDELTRTSVKSSLENPRLRGAPKSPNQVLAVATLSEALACLNEEIFDLAFVDIRLGPYHREGGFELLRHIRQVCPMTVVIMMTSVEDYETMEKCLLAGASDYIFKPFDFQSVHLLMIKARAAHRLSRKQQILRVQAGDQAVTPITLKSRSPLFQKVIEQAKRLKGTDLSVLLLGETGVGKEIFARYLWSIEEDDSRPFVAVHSGGLSKDLVESEIFGHAKGSFTGATENKIGKFQHAHRGDFFLDEIATMPYEVQQKMLRVLQDKRVTPVGSNATVAVDCRIICATNESLEALVKKGAFREDLYFRIRKVVLQIPPLRQRREDIPDLIDYFLNKFSLGNKRLTASAYRLCTEYDWPGNIRQLEGALEIAAKLQEGPEITREDLDTQVFLEPSSALYSGSRPASEFLFSDSGRTARENVGPHFGLNAQVIHRSYKRLLRDFEQSMVGIALKEAGSENAAAEYLGLPRSTLVSRRKSWGWRDPEDMPTDLI